MKKEKTQRGKASGASEGEKDEMKELTETLQRVQADFENYKKQVEKRCQNIEKTACKKLVAELLPILDSFELAMKSLKNSKNFLGHKKSQNDFFVDKNCDEFADGVELVYSQFLSVLEKEGLEVIKANGKKFDPYKHEALLKEKSDEPEDMIIDEMQKGYTLNGEVIRFSKVKLSKGTEVEKK